MTILAFFFIIVGTAADDVSMLQFNGTADVVVRRRLVPADVLRYDEGRITHDPSTTEAANGCECAVKCGVSGQTSVQEICLSPACCTLRTMQDGFTYPETGRGSGMPPVSDYLRLFWSKNSWMTAPSKPEAKVLNAQTGKLEDPDFPAQIAMFSQWVRDGADIEGINTMAAWMMTVATKLAAPRSYANLPEADRHGNDQRKPVALYLDFCDINPICHGKKYTVQWVKGSDHEQLVMADLGKSVDKTHYFLPQKGSRGAFCASEFGRALNRAVYSNVGTDLRIMGQLGEQPVFGKETYADMFESEIEIETLVQHLRQLMLESHAQIDGSFDLENLEDSIKGEFSDTPLVLAESTLQYALDKVQVTRRARGSIDVNGPKFLIRSNKRTPLPNSWSSSELLGRTAARLG